MKLKKSFTKTIKLDYLFIGAHPDDCEIMAGGTMLSFKDRGRSVGIIDLTRGELGSNGSMAIRAEETMQANQVLKPDYRDCLDIKDGQVEINYINEKKLIRKIRQLQPDVVFTFKETTRHPDHENTSKLVKRCCFMAGLKKYDRPTSKQAFRPSAIICFGEAYHIHDRPDFFIDVSKYYKKKIELITSYRSQFKNHHLVSDFFNKSHTKELASKQPSKKVYFPEEKTLIASDLFWNALVGRETWYGSLSGCDYAEGFWCEQIPRLSDPIKHFKKDLN